MAAFRKYPWEEWFAKLRMTLVQGIDYHCSQSSMAQSIRNNASRRGLKVRLQDIGDAIMVQVVGTNCAFPHTDQTPQPV